MRYVLLLTAAALLVTACAAPRPIAQDSDSAAGSARVADGVPTMRAAADLTPWTAYRTFTFAAATVDISPSDMAKIKEIVAYLNSNPSLDIGIDATPTADGMSDADRSLANRRAAAVRRALMDAGAGVASYKIFLGAFADPDHRRAGQIQVLVGPRTGSLTTAL